MKRKGFFSVLCVLLCVVLSLALIGCGNSYTDEDDYANFVRWQARYETEKELVELLREYDKAYKTYNGMVSNGSTVIFSLKGVTVLTDANVKSASVLYDGYDYFLSVYLDSSGAKVLTDITTANLGETLEIVEVSETNRTVLFSATISIPIANGTIMIRQSSESAAKELCGKFSAGAIKNAAVAYNTKRTKVSTIYVSSDYLPTALPETPEFVDVSEYLQKAEAIGL